MVFPQHQSKGWKKRQTQTFLYHVFDKIQARLASPKHSTHSSHVDYLRFAEFRPDPPDESRHPALLL